LAAFKEEVAPTVALGSIFPWGSSPPIVRTSSWPPRRPGTNASDHPDEVNTLASLESLDDRCVVGSGFTAHPPTIRSA